ncbi:HEXXH motif domain-containing protein [Streptomyces sp. NPDC058733]|uniref:HEXXH motif domain-containing protein n=1 Tax=Streptomyces sp. NPDC058733 TaxID=3346614 RepID=UPI0036935DCF
MTSEQSQAHLRMPAGLFAELAAGGGSAQALAFLERGERTRRLLLLRTLLDRFATLPTPLTPPARAWQVVKEAAARAPEPVDRLLLAPATGGWLAHMLRRLHGTATGPDLWAEAGHLCALAVSASLLAGTAAELRVPLTDGCLALPGLGLARLPAARPGLIPGHARTHAGALTLTGPGTTGSTRTSLTLRPTTVGLTTGRAGSESSAAGGVPAGRLPTGCGGGADAEAGELGEGCACPDGKASDGAGWLPLRTLTARTCAGPVAVPLDDLDPYRDLDDPLPPARLEDAEAWAWQRVFEEAVALLDVPGGPGPGRIEPALIRAVVPYGRTAAAPPAPPTVPVSASSGDSYGGMVISRPSSPLALAETLVHEFQHSKLAALLHLFPLLDDDREERYYAPWRADPRHLTGLLHGAYAFTGVAGFWRDRLAATGDEAEAETAGYHFALRRLQCRLVVRTLLTSGRLTPQGRALVAGLAATLDGWLREPVPPTALARARTAARLHRTEWRLRNVAASSSPHSPLRFRPDRAFWPDRRTHAFADAPAAPRTPDEHLAAGDAAAALAGYTEQLADRPTDPHTLAGWIVAHATLEPTRASRRLLTRPEQLQPQPSR